MTAPVEIRELIVQYILANFYGATILAPVWKSHALFDRSCTVSLDCVVRPIGPGGTELCEGFEASTVGKQQRKVFDAE